MIKINTTIKGLKQDFYIGITNIKTDLGSNSLATFGYFLSENVNTKPENAIKLENIAFNYTDSEGLEEQVYKAIEANLIESEYVRTPSRVEQLEEQLAQLQEAFDTLLITNLEGAN